MDGPKPSIQFIYLLAKEFFKKEGQYLPQHPVKKWYFVFQNCSDML